MKGLEDGRSRNIQIFNEKGEKIGRLVTLTEKMLEDDALVQMMLDWRMENKEFFLTQFIPDVEKSRAWHLRENIFNDSKIFFMVEDEVGRLIGHYALKEIDGETAESDNALRGRTTYNKALFHVSTQVVLDFAFDKLEIKRIKEEIFDFNIKSIKVHLKQNEPTKKYLRKTVDRKGQVSHEIVEKEEANVDYCLIVNYIERDVFYEKQKKDKSYRWVIE